MTSTSTANLNSIQRRKNQLKLLILWLVPVGLMAIAGLCYYLVQTGKIQITSKNNGVLVTPPAQLKTLLADNDMLISSEVNGEQKAIWDGMWTLVIRGTKDCDQDCRDSLYLTRQLHIRLDKQANRVQRVYLYDHSGDTENLLSDDVREFLDKEHYLLKVAAVNPEQIAVLDQQLVSDTGERAQFFIVDPEGWAMMYYLKSHEGNEMLQDLKHLLKYSRAR